MSVPGPPPPGQPGPFQPGQYQPGQYAPGQFPTGGPVPPGGQFPPGQYPPGPMVGGPGIPPAKRRRAWPWIVGVLVVALVFMAGIGGCAAAIFLSTRGPIDRSNEFLGHIDDGDFTAAFDLTDPDCFGDGELAQLKSFFTEFELESYDLQGVEVTNDSGAATGTVTLSGAGIRDVRIELNDDDGWKVCSVDVTEQ